MTSKPTARERFEEHNNFLKFRENNIGKEDYFELRTSDYKFLLSLVEAAVEKWAIVHGKSLSEENKERSRIIWWKEIDQCLSRAKGEK